MVDIAEIDLEAAEPSVWDILNSTFTPTQPVQTRDIFYGRSEQLMQCLAISRQSGSHGILHGDRGVGKTSIANVVRILTDNREIEERALKIDCTSGDTFEDIVKHIYQKITVEVRAPAAAGFIRSEEATETRSLASFIHKKTSLNPKHIAETLSGLPGKTLIVLDEFDRLNKKKFSLSAFTELMKILSDRAAKVHFLIVGVGEDVAEIVGDHQSIARNLTQIHLHPMSDDDVEELVTKGVERVGLEMDSAIVHQIVDFSCGYPHYAHLLSLHACTNALNRESETVEQADLEFARSLSITRAHESLKKSYQKATGSNRQNIYKEVLQACGMVDLDEYNTFQPREVAKPLSLILKREMKATQFGSHLIKLCQAERGSILISDGEKGRRRYRFRDPLMRAFVKLNSNSPQRA